jgi:hypothetical protein
MEIQHANMMDEITLKGKLELEQQVVLAMGFNEDKDINDNNVPDVLEVEKFQKEAQIKDRKQSLEEKKFEQSKKEHEDKIKIDKMKARNKK